MIKDPAIKRLTVIGVGLIGGSLARALRLAGFVGEVVGCGRSLANLHRAIELGVIDRYCQDPAQAVAGADLVFIARESIRDPYWPYHAARALGSAVVEDARKVLPKNYSYAI